MTFPNVSAVALAKAKATWKLAIQRFGRTVDLTSADGVYEKIGVKAFAKRPKTMGQFDRTEQSFDQERFVLILDADDFTPDLQPHKFGRATWDGQDHVFLSVTEVELQGVVFGYRIMVKG